MVGAAHPGDRSGIGANCRKSGRRDFRTRVCQRDRRLIVKEDRDLKAEDEDEDDDDKSELIKLRGREYKAFHSKHTSWGRRITEGKEGERKGASKEERVRVKDYY